MNGRMHVGAQYVGGEEIEPWPRQPGSLTRQLPTLGRQKTFERENLKVPNLEPEVEFFVETFSHELAKHLDFTVRRSVANLPRTPLRPFHQLLLLERSTALPKPCSRHANFTIRACLLAQGWQSTSIVSILNKRRCCWVLQLRPRSDPGRLVLPSSKPLAGARTLMDRAQRVLHL